MSKIFFGLGVFIYLSLIAAEEPTSHFISFIIPCYNSADTVEEAIASIYQQNLSIPFEVICLDDCSNDNTKSILEKCSITYDNLIVYAHEKNKGAGAARNLCISHSKGDLIFTLDSDNILVPNSINGLIDLIDKTGCDLAAFNRVRFFRGNYEDDANWVFSPPNNIVDLFTIINTPACNPSYAGNYMYTRKSFDQVGGYPEDCGAVENTAFGLAQLARGNKIALLSDSFHWHRNNGNGYWNRESAYNDANLLKALKYNSEVFSEMDYDYIWDETRNKTVSTWEIWGTSKLKLASPPILESLFRAYACKDRNQYLDAAKEFETAIKHGCKSQKIHRCMQEMIDLAKDK